MSLDTSELYDWRKRWWCIWWTHARPESLVLMTKGEEITQFLFSIDHHLLTMVCPRAV